VSDNPEAASHPVIQAVNRFVDREVAPAAAALDHADAYPHDLVARMRALGLFGCLVPAAYGGLGLSVSTYARVIEELCRGFMSLAGVINSHTMTALIVLHHGTDEQRARLLPRLARGEARGGLCLTEPHAGSDVQAIRTLARRDGDAFVLSGSKMFVTNGREGNTFALLALTDPAAAPRHRGMSCFIVEKGGPGLQVVKSIGKLGYKGVDTAELHFDGFRVPAANLVGGVPGRGFKHVMSGLETGRINIAARAVGVARAALDAAAGAARAMSEPPPTLAGIAARVASSRLITYWAAALKDRGERCDLEAGMAKLHASEQAHEAAVETLRLAGPRGQLAAGSAERLARDTPLMIIGEGTNEIQRLIIARSLLARYGERAGALTSLDGEPEERRQIVQAVRQLVDKAVAPVAQEGDRQGRHPDEPLARLADLGVLGALVPRELGGLELDLSTYVMVIEELARGSGVVAAITALHSAAADALARGGPEEQRLLPALTRGERWATVIPGGLAAHGEVPPTTLTGAALVPHAARAGLFVVRARDEGGAACWALSRERLAVGPVQETLGHRGIETAEVRLDGVEVGPRLGGADGVRVATRLDGVVRLGAAAQAVGIAQAAFEAALRYSQQRSAFGQPICQHQAVQLKLADMVTATTAARLLAAEAARRLDEDGDALHPGLARLQAVEAARMVTLESMRIHGGYGYTTEFPVERFYRDALSLMPDPADDATEPSRLAALLLAGRP
jgi:alkylation response protein AidB-like acyl-CoA dehydrogenase